MKLESRRGKLAAAALLLLAILIAAILAYMEKPAHERQASEVVRRPAVSDDPRVAQLSQQLAELQHILMTMKDRSTPEPSVPARAEPTSEPAPPHVDPQAQRAHDDERRREYMAGVEQAFNNEKVDGVWANRITSRIDDSFAGDEHLRSRLRGIECRSQMCRVQVEDDDTNLTSQRMSLIALALADVLPAMSAEYVPQGNGRNTMILYMSTRPIVGSAGK